MPQVKLSKIFTLLLILLSIPVGVLLLDRKTYFFSRAYREVSGSKANLVINLRQSYELSGKPWKNLSQGGEETDGMLFAVSDKVSMLQPEYIRIDHVFDFYDVLSRNDDGEIVYNWTKLDSEIKAITDIGAKPFISLSYMPQVLSTGSEVDTASNWGEWRQLVRMTIEHISGKYGLGIKDVYYEVWNEPDLFGSYRLYGQKNYLIMYQNASLGAQDAKNILDFKIGGPATTGLYENWFRDFLMYGVRNNLRIDFYSWHRYSTKIEDFEKDHNNVREWIINYPTYSDIEFIITEAGHNSENDIGYDGEYSAIHTMAVNLGLFEKINKVFQFEIKDGPGPEKYWGRWGMLTHESFGEPEEKPRFWAIDFLNNINRGKFPVFGQGTWVKALASGRVDHIKLIIVNYDPYYSHSETVPITFINLPSEKFIYRRSDFLGGKKERTVNINDVSSWNTEEYFTPNTAAMIEIIAQ
ncbi:hypothetical protein JXA63_01350 [Candidatus Woesebacteria bacterium]|nr:hypothetical protein [Candidatus Woesebacteria bacterium]